MHMIVSIPHAYKSDPPVDTPAPLDTTSPPRRLSEETVVTKTTAKDELTEQMQPSHEPLVAHPGP